MKPGRKVLVLKDSAPGMETAWRRELGANQSDKIQFSFARISSSDKPVRGGRLGAGLQCF